MSAFGLVLLQVLQLESCCLRGCFQRANALVAPCELGLGCHESAARVLELLFECRSALLPFRLVRLHVLQLCFELTEGVARDAELLLELSLAFAKGSLRILSAAQRLLELLLDRALPLLLRAQLLFFLAQCRGDLAPPSTRALDLTLDFREALVTLGVDSPQALQLDARPLAAELDVDAASCFLLEAAFQFLQSLLLGAQRLLCLGLRAVRELELTLQLTPMSLAVFLLGPQSLELDARLLELLRVSLGIDSRLLFELTKLIVALRQHAHVLAKRALDCRELVLALLLLRTENMDIRLGHFLPSSFLPWRGNLRRRRQDPFLPPDELGA